MRKTLLPFVAPLVTWPLSCGAERFKRRLVDGREDHTELSTRWAHQQQETEDTPQHELYHQLSPWRPHSPPSPSSSWLSAGHLRLCKLKWVQDETAWPAWAIFYSLEEAVTVFIHRLCRLEHTDGTAIKRTCILYSYGLQTALKLCKPLPHTFVLSHCFKCFYTSKLGLSSLILNVCPLSPGEWIVFLARSRQEASGAGREQHDRTTKPTVQGERRVPLCRPNAPSGVPAPLQAERSICISLQTRWDYWTVNLCDGVLSEHARFIYGSTGDLTVYLMSFFLLQLWFLWTSARSAPLLPALAAKQIQRTQTIFPSFKTCDFFSSSSSLKTFSGNF